MILTFWAGPNYSGSLAGSLLTQLAPLALRNGNGSFDELSVFFSAKTIRVRSYLRDTKHSTDTSLTRNSLPTNNRAT